MSRPRVMFVTGRLAEPALRRVLAELDPHAGFEAEVCVLPITVAALLEAGWISRKLDLPAGLSRVIVPGWCRGELDSLAERWHVPFERGPKDLFDLPEFLTGRQRSKPVLETWNIEILAEINHAPQLSLEQLLRQAESYRANGADLIDLGGIPGERWTSISEAVTALKQEGHRLSVDSFVREDVEQGVAAGAELVLSVNSTNLDWAQRVPAEFVAIPDTPTDLDSLERTATVMDQARRTIRWDPILEPIGFGFAASLDRYRQVRQQHPSAAMMMGVGNVTELSEVDSAGVNFLLAAICEELQIQSILTTEVINWCRSSVREFDLARRLMRHALENRVLPKHLGAELVLLRDPKLHERGELGLQDLAGRITDPNFRIFAERGEVHLMNRDGYWHGPDPYEVFDQMQATVGTLTAEHAFYLGMELMKARTALTLGKQYTQDETLRWGFLTVEEQSAVARRKHREAAGES